MKPIGLSFKNQKLNPYTGRISGELTIVHQCVDCGRISSNRIAGDDNPLQTLRLLEEPKKLNKDVVNELGSVGIKLLTREDREEVAVALFGYDG